MAKKRGLAKNDGAQATEDGFYAAVFSSDELAYLEAKADADDLGDAIALLKVMILRELEIKNARSERVGHRSRRRPGQREPSMNAETIRRYVETLCRALRIRQSLDGKMGQAIDAMMPQILEDVMAEWEMKMPGASGHREMKMAEA